METIDFEAAKKALPLDRSEIAQRLAKTPRDIILDYVLFLQSLKAQLEQYIGLMLAANEPCCGMLLEEIPDERLRDLQIITEHLNDNELLAKIDQLLSATLGNVTKRGSKEKINELLNAIKELDKFKLENVTGACINMKDEQENLSKILLFYLTKKRSDTDLMKYLAKIDEKSLDNAITTCSTMKNVYETMS